MLESNYCKALFSTLFNFILFHLNLIFLKNSDDTIYFLCYLEKIFLGIQVKLWAGCNTRLIYMS